MASPSSVISLGYGSWGSVNLVPTLGYGIGLVAPPRSATHHPALHGPDTRYRDVHGPDSTYHDLSGPDNSYREINGE